MEPEGWARELRVEPGAENHGLVPGNLKPGRPALEPEFGELRKVKPRGGERRWERGWGRVPSADQGRALKSIMFGVNIVTNFLLIGICMVFFPRIFSFFYIIMFEVRFCNSI